MGKSKAKRQKLDSGIGENSGSGDDKTNSEGSSDSWEDIDTSVSSAGGELILCCAIVDSFLTRSELHIHRPHLNAPFCIYISIFFHLAIIYLTD